MAYTVTFQSNGGSVVPPATIENGQEFSTIKPQDPVYDGHDFVGWYTTSAMDKPFVWSRTATGGASMYARWIPHDDVTWFIQTTNRCTAGEPLTWSEYWKNETALPYAPATYEQLWGKTVNTIRFRLGTPGNITLRLINRLTDDYTEVATRVLDCSNDTPNTDVTKSFDDIVIGDHQVFSIGSPSDSGSMKYPSKVSSWTGVANDGNFLNGIGRPTCSSGQQVNLNVDVGYKVQQYVPVTNVTLNKTTLGVVRNESETIVASIIPADATNKNVAWSIVSGSDYISLTENGLSCEIHGVANGTSVVQVTTDDGGFTATCTVNVTDREHVVHTATFDSNGGSTVADITYNALTPTITLPTPVRDGFHFVGWFTNGEILAGEIHTTIPTGTYEDKRFYAKWVNQTIYDKYHGKTFSVLGDSISTFWTKSGPTSQYSQQVCERLGITEHTTYWGQFAQALGMTAANLDAINGTCVMSSKQDDVGNAMANRWRIESLAANGVNNDVIVIYAGTNDAYMHSTNIGIFDPNASYVHTLDTTTVLHTSFAQAYTLMITRVKAMYPNAEILVIEPYDYIGSLTSQMVSCQAVNKVISDVCEYFDINHTDLRTAGIDPGVWPYEADTYDGTHPNNSGFSKIANAFIENLSDTRIIHVNGVSLDKNSIDMFNGQRSKITATVTPDNAYNKNVTFYTPQTNIISIHQRGSECIINALQAGDALITVTTSDGGFTDQCDVHVEQPEGTIYKYTTKDGCKLQVDSAIRDGNGRKIETNYVRTVNNVSPVDGNVDIDVEVPTKVSQLENDAGYLINSDVSMSYDSSSKQITLTGKDSQSLGTVDCTDFIKDGMISSVAYDESTHVIHIIWNTDAGSKTTDINLSGLIDTYTAGEGLELNNGEFSVDTSVIATREYVDNSVPSLSDYYTKDESNQIMASVVASGRDYTDSHVESVISDYYSKNETSSSTELDAAFSKCSNVTLISGDAPFASDLSVVKITNDDYNKLVVDGAINESALYVITDDYTSFRGQQIKDVAEPTDDNDAATKKYVDSNVSYITSELTGFGKTISYDTSVKKIYLKNGTSILGTVDCTDFIKDGMISSVSYDESTHIIHIVWNTDAGSKTTDINLSGLIDVYTAGEGLNLVNGQFSVDTSIIATREYVDNSVSSLSDYYTKDESNQIMASVVASGRDYTDSHVESVISDYYLKTETSSSTEISNALNSLDKYECLSNKVSSISEDSTDTQYPTARVVWDISDYIDGFEKAVYGEDKNRKFTEIPYIDINTISDTGLFSQQLNFVLEQINYEPLITEDSSYQDVTDAIQAIYEDQGEECPDMTDMQSVVDAINAIATESPNMFSVSNPHGMLFGGSSGTSKSMKQFVLELKDKISQNKKSVAKNASDIAELSSGVNELSSYAHSHIAMVNNNGQVYSNSLSVYKITRQKYIDLVNEGKESESAVYVITDPGINAYNQRISCVADPVDDTDAVNKKYMNNELNDMNTRIGDVKNVVDSKHLNDYAETDVIAEDEDGNEFTFTILTKGLN